MAPSGREGEGRASIIAAILGGRKYDLRGAFEWSRAVSSAASFSRHSVDVLARNLFRCGQEVAKPVSFRGANTNSSTADRPVTATPASSSPRLLGSCIAISTMTAACATLDHAANAIKLRCVEGLRAASTKKRPSVAYMVQNIGAVVPAVGPRPARKRVPRGRQLATTVKGPKPRRTT